MLTKHRDDEQTMFPPDPEADQEAMQLQEFQSIVQESICQPPWREDADKAADYADGNQLDTELLRKQQAAGIPPAKENVIGPAIAAVCGYEAKTRTDWRVTPDGDPEGRDVADALNYKLNQAERHSRADKALSDAFRAMVTTGLAWLEPSRSSNSLDYPYKVRYVHRNEIWWDMQAREPDLSDARWLYRRRWIDRELAAGIWPEYAEIIRKTAEKWIADITPEMLDGGHSTGLMRALDAERAWTQIEDAWYNTENRTVCITELWYRRWNRKPILRMKNGRAVEFDPMNMLHVAAVKTKQGSLREELVPEVRRAYWVGPHRLYDGPSPYKHRHFGYIPMWGFREDMTGIPYGMVRDMIFPQDNLNSAIAKLRWGMSAVETIRTAGALAMSDQQFRQMSSRVDADFVLDAEHFRNNPGARFERKRDYQLSDQHFQLMNDSRLAIERISVPAAFKGQQGTATSGIQEQTQLEQSQTSLASLFDNFREARTLVGECLLSFILEDIADEETTVIIEGDVLTPTREVVLNKPEVDEFGIPYLSNDTQRTRLKVALEDVPTTSSFRAQQLQSLTEAVKVAPPQLLQVVLPFMVNLMDVPQKDKIVEALQQASQQPDPETMRKQIEQEVRLQLLFDLKAPVEQARAKLLEAQSVKEGVTGTFAAMQAAEKIALNPQIAPVGDIVMQQAGWRPPIPAGQDPNIPTPVQAGAVEQPGGLPGDTDPLTPLPPADPESAAVGAEQGVETLRAD